MMALTCKGSASNIWTSTLCTTAMLTTGVALGEAGTDEGVARIGAQPTKTIITNTKDRILSLNISGLLYSCFDLLMTTLYKKRAHCWYGKTLQEHGQKTTHEI